MTLRCLGILCILTTGFVGGSLWAEPTDHPPQNSSTSPNDTGYMPKSMPTYDSKDITEGRMPEGAIDLMINGNFEQPATNNQHPLHWQSPDNLVWFWTTDPASPDQGKVIKIDTDVYQRQAYDWWIRLFLKNDPLSNAPAKVQPVGHKYDTIGGLDGGFYWSDYIPIKAGSAYKVFIDAKGPAAMVFIRGFEKQHPLSFANENPAVQELFRKARGEPLTDSKGRPIRFRPQYRYQRWFVVGGSEQWKTYTHIKPAHPTGRELTEDVRWLRIMIYPYWPAATYWFDNVRLIEVEPELNQGQPPAEEADLEEGKVVR